MEKDTTKGGLRDMIYSALQDEGVVVALSGDNRLIVKGTAANPMSFVKFTATKPQNEALNPTIKDISQAGRNSTADVTPNWDVKVVNP